MRAVVVLPLVPVMAAMGTREEAPGREQHVDDRRGDVARRAFARRDMHAKSGRRIHFADAAADGAVAFGNVFGQKIHAPHVQADGTHRALRHLAVVGMDDIGDVGGRAARGQVRGRAQIDDLRRGSEPTRRAAPTRSSIFSRLRVELEARQHLFVAHAAARILDSRSRSTARSYALPSPTTCPGVRRVAATSSPFTTSRRWSSPSKKGLDDDRA